MKELLTKMELKLSERFPQGPTEEEVDNFCYEHKLFNGSEKRKQFIAHIYRKND